MLPGIEVIGTRIPPTRVPDRIPGGPITVRSRPSANSNSSSRSTSNATSSSNNTNTQTFNPIFSPTLNLRIGDQTATIQKTQYTFARSDFEQPYARYGLAAGMWGM